MPFLVAVDCRCSFWFGWSMSTSNYPRNVMLSLHEYICMCMFTTGWTFFNLHHHSTSTSRMLDSYHHQGCNSNALKKGIFLRLKIIRGTAGSAEIEKRGENYIGCTKYHPWKKKIWMSYKKASQPVTYSQKSVFDKDNWYAASWKIATWECGSVVSWLF